MKKTIKKVSAKPKQKRWTGSHLKCGSLQSKVSSVSFTDGVVMHLMVEDKSIVWVDGVYELKLKDNKVSISFNAKVLEQKPEFITLQVWAR